MITNERQYKVTKGRLAEFKETLARVGTAPREKKLGAEAIQMMRESIESQIEDFEQEIADYDKLKAGQMGTYVAKSLSDIAIALIRARVARQLTQRQLAERLKIQEQQLQRYEATQYRGVSIERLQEVADALKLQIREEIRLG